MTVLEQEDARWLNEPLVKLVESVEGQGEGELTCVALESAGAGPGSWAALWDRGWIRHPAQDVWCFDRRRADMRHAERLAELEKLRVMP